MLFFVSLSRPWLALKACSMFKGCMITVGPGDKVAGCLETPAARAAVAAEQRCLQNLCFGCSLHSCCRLLFILQQAGILHRAKVADERAAGAGGWRHGG